MSQKMNSDIFTMREVFYFNKWIDNVYYGNMNKFVAICIQSNYF